MIWGTAATHDRSGTAAAKAGDYLEKLNTASGVSDIPDLVYRDSHLKPTTTGWQCSHSCSFVLISGFSSPIQIQKSKIKNFLTSSSTPRSPIPRTPPSPTH